MDRHVVDILPADAPPPDHEAVSVDFLDLGFHFQLRAIAWAAAAGVTGGGDQAQSDHRNDAEAEGKPDERLAETGEALGPL